MKRLSGRDSDFYLLESTGRRVYANNGILGIDSQGDVWEGYDGSFGEEWPQRFTPEERKEIADVMIARWQQWRDE